MPLRLTLPFLYALAFAAVLALLARDHAREWEYCERIHARATCQHILR